MLLGCEVCNTLTKLHGDGEKCECSFRIHSATGCCSIIIFYTSGLWVVFIRTLLSVYGTVSCR
jgi:hypothetical protein